MIIATFIFFLWTVVYIFSMNCRCSYNLVQLDVSKNLIYHRCIRMASVPRRYQTYIFSHIKYAIKRQTFQNFLFHFHRSSWINNFKILHIILLVLTIPYYLKVCTDYIWWKWKVYFRDIYVLLQYFYKLSLHVYHLFKIWVVSLTVSAIYCKHKNGSMRSKTGSLLLSLVSFSLNSFKFLIPFVW
jgi:hypothetical protein